MDFSKGTELKVGIFVALGIALFVISVVMLGSDTAFFKKTYNLKVEFDQVQGLATGSVVQLLGLPIGNVSDIKIVNREGKNMLELTMTVDRDFQKQITEGSIAGVRTQGALGDKYIYLTPGPPNATPIADNGHIPPEARGDFFETIAQSTDKIDNLFKAVEEAHKLLANLNHDGKSAQLMENLVGATDELKKMARDFRGGEGNESKLRQSLVSLSSILQKIDNGSGTLGALINDKSVFENIKRMLGGSSKEKYIKSLVRETIQSSEGSK